MSKIIEIKVQVEVPDGFEYVAFDSYGSLMAYRDKPRKSRRTGAFVVKRGDDVKVLDILNWEKTLTKVGDSDTDGDADGPCEEDERAKNLARIWRESPY